MFLRAEPTADDKAHLNNFSVRVYQTRGRFSEKDQYRRLPPNNLLCVLQKFLIKLSLITLYLHSNNTQICRNSMVSADAEHQQYFRCFSAQRVD